MNIDHDRIDELLAGYVLQGLSGDDATEADRLLAEHVPDCITCRRTLADFQDLTGELALVAEPVHPPETLLPSLHRELRPHREPRTRGAFLYAAAAVLVVAVGLAGWNFLTGGGATTSEQRQQAQASMLNTLLQEDGSQMVALHGGSADTATAESPTPALSPTPAPAPTPPLAPPGVPTTAVPPGFGEPAMILSYRPGVLHLWVFGTNIPQPEPGAAYALWLVEDGRHLLQMRFLPGPGGYVQQFVPVDLSAYDAAIVTVEPIDADPNTRVGQQVWGAVVYP